MFLKSQIVIKKLKIVSVFFSLLFWLNGSLYAQTVEDVKKELAYWYKHPAEWKSYKLAWAKKQQDHQKYLDSVKSFQNFRYSLQTIYDSIADRMDIADSLITQYTGQKNAMLKQKQRNKHQLTFKVQIQLAQKHELDIYALPHTALSIEKIEKGQKRYMIGKFKVYEEAQAFAEVLRNGGAKAYIVAYKNGHRLKNFADYLD